jgi:hypothetical protein
MTLAMPAPGTTETLVPGIDFWINSAIAPPKGYHDPPIGPVINFKSTFSWLEAKTGTNKQIIKTAKNFILIPPFFDLLNDLINGRF